MEAITRVASVAPKTFNNHYVEEINNSVYTPWPVIAYHLTLNAFIVIYFITTNKIYGTQKHYHSNDLNSEIFIFPLHTPPTHLPSAKEELEAVINVSKHGILLAVAKHNGRLE